MDKMGFVRRKIRGMRVININLPAPPPNYVADVKNPGEAFLRCTPNPTQDDWRRHSYWRKIHDYLYNSHNGICLYCASWTPRNRRKEHFDYTTIDHYIPKKIDKTKVYEWDNFRLCRARLNHRKADFSDVLDPCSLSNEWFILEFTTFLIKPSFGLDEQIKIKVRQTIERLELNLDTDYVNERIAIIRDYSIGTISFDFIRLKYPFIAYQMVSQRFDETFKDKIARYFRTNGDRRT